MEKQIVFLFLSLLPLLASCTQKQVVYIVYLGEHSGDKALHEIEESHHSYLYSVKATEEEAKASLLYSYKHHINGFAALLTPDEASKLSELEETVSVFPSKIHSSQTTRSWEFVGLDEEAGLGLKFDNFGLGRDQEGGNGRRSDRFRFGRQLLRRAGYGRNIIIGMVDSGVWPESKSFRDEGMGPIPKSWKGICQTGDSFNSSNCNRKIIGTRFYSKGYEQYYKLKNVTADTLSPRDLDGHGTHTASTVAGNRVRNAAAYGGFARGTASGGAPLAHLAIYKACWAVPDQEKVNGNFCSEEDMLAAIDDAIADGVDVLSMSIGAHVPLPYAQDGIAIGALHAVKKNIVVVCAAGNSGPKPSSLSNTAPWILTVGASSVDRVFWASVVLGNGKKIVGQSATPYGLKRKHRLVLAEDVVKPGVPSNLRSQCLEDSLSRKKTKGKVVFCMRGNGTRIGKGVEVKRAGGVGLILGNPPFIGNQLMPDAHVLPATALTAVDTIELQKYINSTKRPKALVGLSRTVLNHKPAPFMAGFTSRGPSVADPNILKPDIAAPGLNILAAWSGGDAPSKLSFDNRRVEYNLHSGTSMACPHAAAAATLLKAIYPTWSSAAIRSALMTTASSTNNLGSPINDEYGKDASPFQLGSGQLQPSKAADPGLIYDTSYEDYIAYLGNHGLELGVNDRAKPKRSKPSYNLNYPSIAVPKINGSLVVTRTVTNVGPARSEYSFVPKPPSGYSFVASPSTLLFNKVGQKRTFTITITAINKKLAKLTYNDNYAFGWYTWTDRVHRVRSPVAVALQ